MKYGRHKTERLRAPWGDQVPIDCGIANLISLLWKLGLATIFSCEDHQGEVEIGVPRAEIAAWVWAFAHADEKPTGEQAMAWQQQLETLQRGVREQKASQVLAWYRREIEELEREIQEEPLAWRQEQLEDLQQEMREYEQEGTAWQSERGFIQTPDGELRVSPVWRWTIRPNVIYCLFPPARQARVEANLAAVLRWRQSGRERDLKQRREKTMSAFDEL